MRVLIVLMILAGLVLFAVGFITYYHYDVEADTYRQSNIEAEAVFLAYSPQPFRNSAADATPFTPEGHVADALYLFEAPEGFTIVSHSLAWDADMLELLYRELMKNEHGDEIDILYEVIIYPHEDDDTEITALATYTPGVNIVSFFIQFPALPDDFNVGFPQDIGRINIYGGDARATIESMASSLSHEYGHLYTLFYMLDPELIGSDSLAGTRYAELREASRFNLITSVTPGDDYFQERYRYLIEVAAEDFVQLMGSPTTRQVVDFVDIQQILNGAEQPTDILRARNAFPQENMMLPLANEVPGLEAYFRSYIGCVPRVPVEEKQEVTLQIRQNSVQHNLVTGLRTFVYYTITWNTPYQEAIYTLVSYDPHDYRGWGDPIKTVRPGQNASAIIGEYVTVRGDQVHSIDDGRAEGVKVFFVVALLPDGTFYMSEKFEFNFD